MLVAFAAPARAIELAALVPDDIGMCFQARDLVEHGGRFFNSELFRRLMVFEPAAEFLEEYANRPRQVGQLLADRMGMPSEEFGEKAFGQRSMLAIWPGEFRSSADSRLLFLAETDSAEFAQRMVEVFGQTLDQPGVLVRSEEVSHAGARYSVRVRRGERRLEICLAAVDNVFLLASGESLMRQSLELRTKSQPAPRSLAAYPPYQASQQHQQADSPMSLVILPKRWLDLVTERLDDDDATQPYEAGAKQAVLDGWRVADYWIFAIRTGDRLSLESYLHFEPDRKPAWLDQMARGAEDQATFLDHVPADAVVAYAGKLNVSEIGYLVLVGAASGDGFKLGNLDEIRQATRGMMMGLDPIDDILPSMGPDVGFFVSRTKPLPPAPLRVVPDIESTRDKPDAAADEDRPNIVPDAQPAADNDDGEIADTTPKPSKLDPTKPTWLEMVIGVRTNPRPTDDKRPDVKLALDNGLRTAMVLAAGVENAKRGQRSAQVAVTRVGDLKLTTLSGLEQMPPGMDLTYTFVNDFFIGGLSLGTVKRSASLEQPESLAAQARFRRLLDDSAGQPAQVLYIDCLALRNMLAEDPDLLFQTFSPFREMTQANARKSQELVMQLLSLTDTFLLTARVEGSGLSISLAIDSPSPEAVVTPVTLQK
ncbi:MAG: hypothetical protein K2Y37_11295 [Pirellulales bacterium]|nr:hypothetical protein [Pirellulales bacterium]